MLNPILQRIKKLMALAANNPDVHEASAAAMKAQALMNEYHLSDSQVDEAVLGADPMGFHACLPKQAALWKRAFFASVARLNSCCSYWIIRGETRLVGRQSDREVVECLVTYLIRQIEQAATNEYPNTDQKIVRADWKRSFAVAAVHQIIARMTVERTEVVEHALVLRRDLAAQAYLSQLAPKMREREWSTDRASESAVLAGSRFGKSVEWRKGVADHPLPKALEEGS
jgi:hypothetical protein